MTGSGVDILCLGEPLFEFAWQPDGTILPGIGGDVSNCAVAAARAGARVSMLTRLGVDHFGAAVRALYHSEGIADRWVRDDPEAPTGLYFIEYQDGRHQFSYRRAGSAASRIAPADLTPEMFHGVRVLHSSGISQAISASSRDTVSAAMRMAQDAGALVSFDTNLRLNLWSATQARAALEAVMPQVDLVFPSLEDAQSLFDDPDPERICARFLDMGASRVLLTLGAAGVLVADAQGQTLVAGLAVELVDATGAGDTFDGAFLAEYLRSKDALGAARFATAAAALSVGHRGAVAAIPTRAQIVARLAL